MSIDIEYDGVYPNLCAGMLQVVVAGVCWQFPERCLSSGGSVFFDEDGHEEVEGGPWTIVRWPARFPDNRKRDVEAAVNEQIPWGCCGGCI
jgi:hypothetical protein